MYTREDKVPSIFAFFLCSEGLPSIMLLYFAYFPFFPSLCFFQLPTSAWKGGAEVVSGHLRAVGSGGGK